MKTKTYYWDDSQGWLTKVDMGDEIPMEGTLGDLIVALRRIQEEHPVLPTEIKYEISVESGDWEDAPGRPVVEIYYERPATEEEIGPVKAERLARHASRDAWEYNQYQTLKQKFRGM